jgi:hypothetical protein
VRVTLRSWAAGPCSGFLGTTVSCPCSSRASHTAYLELLALVAPVSVALLRVGIVLSRAFGTHPLKLKHYERCSVCSLRSRERGQCARCGVARGFQLNADVSIVTDGVGECSRSAGQRIQYVLRLGGVDQGNTRARLAGFRTPRLRMNAIRVAGWSRAPLPDRRRF